MRMKGPDSLILRSFFRGYLFLNFVKIVSDFWWWVGSINPLLQPAEGCSNSFSFSIKCKWIRQRIGVFFFSSQ